MEAPAGDQLRAQLGCASPDAAQPVATKQHIINHIRRYWGNSLIAATGLTPFRALSAAGRQSRVLEKMGMIKSGLGVTVAVLIVSIAVSGVLHIALSQYRSEANAAVSGEITSSIPR
jgi:hypothetical protein